MSEKKTALLKHIQNADYIRIVKDNDEEDFQCVPIAMSEELVMVLVYLDFIPYGYEIIPLQLIQAVSRSASDCYFGKIVKAEGLNGWIEAAPKINLKNWNTLFSFFLKTQEFVMLDIGAEGGVDIGVVTEVGENSLTMRCFSATGIWDTQEWSELYSCLTGVQLRNHYIKTFEKYLPRPEM